MHNHHETNYRSNLPQPFLVIVRLDGITAEYHQIASIGVGHKDQSLVLVPVGAIVDPPTAEPIVIHRSSYDSVEFTIDPLPIEDEGENCSLR